MGSRNKNKKKRKEKAKNNTSISVVKQNQKKKKTKPVKIQTFQSKKLNSLPPKQDPIVKTDAEKLFEKVKAKVDAIKAAKTTNAHDIPFHDISASTPEKAYPLEKKIENGERDYLGDLSNVSQRAEVTTDAGPLLVRNRVQRLIDSKNKKIKKKKKKGNKDIKIQTHLEQSDNISPIVGRYPTSFDPVKVCLVKELPEYKKKKKMKKNKKKSTTDIKIQTLLKQLDNISSIVRCCPTCFDPVKESLLQVLPQYEVPEPVSNIGSNPKIFKCENDNITVLKPKKKKMKKKKKTTNVKIQTLLEQSDNTPLIVGCCPASFVPVKESLVQELPECENIKLESLPKKQDPISKKDLEKSLEEVKVNTQALKAAGNANAQNIPFYDMSASTPDKAYPLEKIIEKEEWDCLGDLLNFPEGAKLTPEAYPIFVCNRVQKLEEMKDECEKRTVASVLQYITHLIKYKDKHSFEGYKSVKDHKFPSILEEKFRTMFNESSSRILSFGKRKLLINYVLVLTLLVDGYESDASDITKDLKTDFLEVKKQYKRLGCEIVHEKPVLLVTLPAPSKFPVTSKNL